jgi:hypothetical protein
MLEKYFETKDQFGSLTLYKDIERGLFVVEPRGVINPGLVKIDLKKAYDFGQGQQQGWIYLVNSTSVLFPNPLNLLYLKKIKSLPYLKQYVIYAPSTMVRALVILASFIVKPDLILKSEDEYQNFIKQKG